MEFWIVSDGEKEGPFLDFDLRTRIREGEVQRDQKVWHADLDGWTPIGELELFANEFKDEVKVVTGENVEDYLADLDEEEATTPSPPPVPAELHIARRFGARWFDYLAYMALFFVWVALAGVDLKGLQQRPLFPLILVLPWIFLEAAALHFWGTTPGKWLTGLQVRGPEGNKLAPGAAFLRTVRVMILGMGFTQIILREICQAVALWFAVKKKVVLWDTSVGNRLETAAESPRKWVAFGVGMLLSLILLTSSAYHVGLSQMTDEERAEYEEMQDKIEQFFGPKK